MLQIHQIQRNLDLILTGALHRIIVLNLFLLVNGLLILQILVFNEA